MVLSSSKCGFHWITMLAMAQLVYNGNMDATGLPWCYRNSQKWGHWVFVFKKRLQKLHILADGDLLWHSFEGQNGFFGATFVAIFPLQLESGNWLTKMIVSRSKTFMLKYYIFMLLLKPLKPARLAGGRWKRNWNFLCFKFRDCLEKYISWETNVVSYC